MREIRSCNVAVVGGAGFLGSHLVDYLIKDRNCEVTVVDNLCAGRREFIHPLARFIHHDITGSEEFLTSIFKSHGICYVFNYAAWPYIPVSFQRPMQVFSVNANGAMKVINAAQAAGCIGILQVSSAEIYGNCEGQINEFAPVGPRSTYGAAKLAVDYYCQTAWKERQTPVIALRQFNCVGERETHPYVIPEIISQLSEGRNRNGMYYQVDLGNNTERDFLYAGDAVRGAVLLLEHGQFGEVYNLGSEGCISIYELAQLIGELMGRPCVVRKDAARVRPWEIWHLWSDNTRLYGATGFTPTFTLRDALVATIDSFRKTNRWCWSV